MDNLEKDAPDEGPLVRLGEGLVVDWNAQAYDALFNGGADDTMRGEASWSKVPVFPDPELQAKRTALKQRRKNGITLDDCLNEFGKEEVLSEMDTWYCPRCKEHRRATKKFELWKTPDILVMHLKRFSSSAFRRDKLDVFVDFPIEGLDLTSRVIETEEGKQEIYDLFAVDDHWGGLGGGHYTAFAKNFVDNEWYEYNGKYIHKARLSVTLTALQIPRSQNRKIQHVSSLRVHTCSSIDDDRMSHSVGLDFSKSFMTMKILLMPQRTIFRSRGKTRASSHIHPFVGRRAL